MYEDLSQYPASPFFEKMLKCLLPLFDRQRQKLVDPFFSIAVISLAALLFHQ